MNNNCKNILELFCESLDSILSEDKLRLIEKHISECENCKKEFEKILITASKLKELNNFIESISPEKTITLKIMNSIKDEFARNKSDSFKQCLISDNELDNISAAGNNSITPPSMQNRITPPEINPSITPPNVF
ncbi:MAG TPA: zf-HC2 domain-containing protein [bacterium]|nr:zf-HC2 domain-containing protein [bacterium]HPN30368.1 zf-HC2 domain-containing protein [bacterium]